MRKLGAQELRKTEPTEDQIKSIKKNPIYIILDNVLDTYNVGSIFRLADAVSAEKVNLCGQTEIPPNSRIKKASINTTEWVSWEYAVSAEVAIKDLRLKLNDLKVYAVEQSLQSVPYQQMIYEFPAAFVVGNETNGVSEEVLKMADGIVEIPMYGVNKSLNVMVSLGIVLFEAIKVLAKPEK